MFVVQMYLLRCNLDFCVKNDFCFFTILLMTILKGTNALEGSVWKEKRVIQGEDEADDRGLEIIPKKQKGSQTFQLEELLIVFGILGIHVALLVPAFDRGRHILARESEPWLLLMPSPRHRPFPSLYAFAFRFSPSFTYQIFQGQSTRTEQSIEVFY